MIPGLCHQSRRKSGLGVFVKRSQPYRSEVIRKKPHKVTYTRSSFLLSQYVTASKTTRAIRIAVVLGNQVNPCCCGLPGLTRFCDAQESRACFHFFSNHVAVLMILPIKVTCSCLDQQFGFRVSVFYGKCLFPQALQSSSGVVMDTSNATSYAFSEILPSEAPYPTPMPTLE